MTFDLERDLSNPSQTEGVSFKRGDGKDDSK